MFYNEPKFYKLTFIHFLYGYRECLNERRPLKLLRDTSTIILNRKPKSRNPTSSLSQMALNSQAQMIQDELENQELVLITFFGSDFVRTIHFPIIDHFPILLVAKDT